MEGHSKLKFGRKAKHLPGEFWRRIAYVSNVRAYNLQAESCSSHHLQGAGHIVSASLQAVQLVLYVNFIMPRP